jgi:uncharacterized cupredoxin-like copper-binding protein
VSRAGRLAVATLAALGVAGAGYGLDAAAGDEPDAPPLGPDVVTIRLDVEHSLFEPSEVRVVEGTRVRFVVDNGDPINHELIVGPESVHARHRTGDHATHPSVAGEVSVAPNALGVTTYEFDSPGTVEFACHLPGHYEHGMHGKIEVVPAA